MSWAYLTAVAFAVAVAGSGEILLDNINAVECRMGFIDTSIEDSDYDPISGAVGGVSLHRGYSPGVALLLLPMAQ